MANRATVMVVEDDDDLRKLFATYLKDDYTVVTASTGQAALEKLDDHIDIILLDRLLPESRGADLLKEFTGRGDFGIAMVTAVKPGVDIVEMGIQEYLTKPISRGELRDTVESLVRIRSYDDKLTEYLSLARKRAALLEERNEEELEESGEFERLVERLERTRDAVDNLEETIPDSDADMIFHELF